jgi:PAS domain S-box-containing protein
MASPPSPPGESDAKGPAASGAISILLVDDDPKNLLALESVLESPEHRLVKAQTADEALLALMREDHAAIVLDVQMPDLNGIDLARLIKQRKRSQHIPIIFLTAHYREHEHAVLGYDVGAVDYLVKPVHPAVLRSKVAVFVDLFRKSRALAEVNRSMEAEIEERKTAEERFRVVVEAAPSAMAVCTRAGAIVMVNSQAEQLFACSRKGLLASRLMDFVPPEALPELSPSDAGPATMPPARGAAREATVRRGDGSSVPVEISLTPIMSAEGPRWLASIVDITERKRAAEALQTANAELEAKNLALEKQAEERVLRLRAEAARAEAEAANAAKDRFLAMLSHELRTPLSPVLHSVTLVEDHPQCPQEIRNALDVIKRNVQLEARLIDDLLDLSRVRNGKLRLQPQTVDAHEVLSHALEICHPGIAARSLEVTTRLLAQDRMLNADPARLQQVFWNVISNAVKFTPEGGSISVSTQDCQPGPRIRIEVTDSGAGIEPEKLPLIFDAFEQASPAGVSGLGLGLAICKALVELHGGTIIARSAGLGLGSTLTLEFPAMSRPVETPAIGRPDAPRPELAPLRLLVVEDHSDTADVLTRLLARRGYEVRSADSFNAAATIAGSCDFDVLVTDLGLPDGDGIELFQELRRMPGHENLVGIALSGFGMDEDIARSQSVGFIEHLTKPVDFALLQRVLARIGDEVQLATAQRST